MSDLYYCILWKECRHKCAKSARTPDCKLNIYVLPAKEVIPLERLYFLVLWFLQQAVTQSWVYGHVTVKRGEKRHHTVHGWHTVFLHGWFHYLNCSFTTRVHNFHDLKTNKQAKKQTMTCLISFRVPFNYFGFTCPGIGSIFVQGPLRRLWLTVIFILKLSSVSAVQFHYRGPSSSSVNWRAQGLTRKWTSNLK